MWVFLFSLSFVVIWLNNNLLNFLSHYSTTLHNVCLNLSPASSIHRSIYQAILCNHPPPPDLFLTDLRKIGLYHLIVISGSHLVLLETIITKLSRYLKFKADSFIFLILTIFTLTCEFAAPITRAWISFMLRKISDEETLCWRAHHVTLYSGAFSILLFPQWMTSLSFLLSWGASLYLSVEGMNHIKKHFVIYLGLFPLLYTLQLLHPISAIVNWLLGPIIGFFLLLISLAGMICPPVIFISDGVINFMAWLCSKLANEFGFWKSESSNTSYLWMWFFILINQFLINRYSIHKQRTRK